MLQQQQKVAGKVTLLTLELASVTYLCAAVPN